MTAALLVAVALLLAYANGANDTVKGVATLFGSRTAGYRRALGWAAAATFAGSLASAVLARGLARAFCGGGMVPAADPAFLAAAGAGAAGAVLAATRLGLPVSTTHALVGGLVGAGFARAGAVDAGRLGTAFVLPLLVSPLVAAALAALAARAASVLRSRLGITKETCVCVGTATTPAFVPLSRLASAPAASLAAGRTIAFSIGAASECVERYDGRVLGIRVGAALDAVHYLSAGAVSFVRGLNDTPKIAGLLAVGPVLGTGWAGPVAVAAVMTAGGLLSSRRVAETMGRRITAMNHGQGFVANAVTAGLVAAASVWGLPVSTTHVCCGALFGLGAATGAARWRTIRGILLAWVATLPLAAILAAAAGRLG